MIREEPKQQKLVVAQINKSRKSSTHFVLRKQAEIFRIICKGCNLALRPQVRQKLEPTDEVKIMGSIIDQKSIKQYWMRRKLRDGRYEILNYFTDLYIDSSDREEKEGVRLERKLDKNSQKFQLEEIFQVGTRIKEYNSNPAFYLSLDGIVEKMKGDEEDESQIFQFERVQNPFSLPQFKNTYMIVQSTKHQCLGLTTTSQPQAQLSKIQLCPKTDQINQMWQLQPIFDESASQQTKYSILNLLNKKRIWPGEKGQIIQGDQKTKIWQLRKRHAKTGELYCVQEGKYLNFDSGVAENWVGLAGSSNGTKWQFI